MTDTISTRELQHELPKVARRVRSGHTLKVLRYGKPLFTIIPSEEGFADADRLQKLFTAKNKPKKIKKGELLKAFRKIQFKGGDPLVSQKIDSYLYGAPYDPTRY